MEDWTTLFKDYKGLWVALKADEKTVVASGKNLKKVKDSAIETGLSKPIMLKVPKNLASYIG